jgi:hypothetical protein
MRICPSILVGSLLLLSTHRSPAPIQESLSKQEAARFAGTWTGRIKFGGNLDAVEFTLVINPEATSMIQSSRRFGEFTHPTTVNAGVLSWIAGPTNRNVWTLTPNPDGQTAVVKVKPVAGEEGAATFQRVEPPSKRGRAGVQSKSRP